MESEKGGDGGVSDGGVSDESIGQLLGILVQRLQTVLKQLLLATKKRLVMTIDHYWLLMTNY